MREIKRRKKRIGIQASFGRNPQPGLKEVEAVMTLFTVLSELIELLLLLRQVVKQAIKSRSKRNADSKQKETKNTSASSQN